MKFCATLSGSLWPCAHNSYFRLHVRVYRCVSTDDFQLPWSPVVLLTLVQVNKQPFSFSSLFVDCVALLPLPLSEDSCGFWLAFLADQFDALKFTDGPYHAELSLRSSCSLDTHLYIHHQNCCVTCC